MASLTLISGPKAQAASAMPASDLYLSRWFLLARALAECRGPWRVLSTRHGLLMPEVVIEPYEPRKPGPVWYEEVASDLLGLTQPGDTVTVLASNRHAEALGLRLTETGRSFEMPLQSMTLDEQVLWLEQQLGNQDVPIPGSRQRSDEEKQARRARRAARGGR